MPGWPRKARPVRAAGCPPTSSTGGLATVTPCCAVAVSLNDLNYIWPAGFARFEIQVRSPGRGWLSPEEMNQVSAELGIAVRQIMSYY